MGGVSPRGSDARPEQRCRQEGDEVGLGTCARECEAHAMANLLDTGRNLQEPETQGDELGKGKIAQPRGWRRAPSA